MIDCINKQNNAEKIFLCIVLLIADIAAVNGIYHQVDLGYILTGYRIWLFELRNIN